MANASQSGGPRLRVVFLSRRALVCLVLLVCVVGLISSNRFWRWMYPIEYQSMIQQASATYRVDPLLVASVIRVESKFRSEDVSHAGAIGLMQLMPNTAQWIAGNMRQEGQVLGPAVRSGRPESLAEPSVNIQIGTWYLSYLKRQFNGNQVAAIAAYNGGPKRVQQWLQSGQWNGSLSTITNIPVGETRHFVDRVFYNYDLYKRIYGQDEAWRTIAGKN